MVYSATSFQSKLGTLTEDLFKEYLDNLNINHHHPGYFNYGPDKGDVVISNKNIVIDVKTNTVKNTNFLVNLRKDVQPDYYVFYDNLDNVNFKLYGAIHFQDFIKNMFVVNCPNGVKLTLLQPHFPSLNLLKEILS